MDSQQNVIYHDKIHDWNIYIPSLFNQNKLYNHTVNCLLIDLQKIWSYSLNISKFLSHTTTIITTANILFWNNNPINKFIVCGNVISYNFKYFNNQEYIIFQLDDNSFNNNNNYNISKEHKDDIHLPKFIINKILIDDDLLLSSNNLNQLKNLHIEVSNCNFIHDTIQINKIINYNFTLLEQIQFWKLAIDDKLCFQDYIWTIQRIDSYSNENKSNNNSKDLRQQIFIENLNNNIIKKNLEILSPYLEPTNVESSNDISMISDLDKSKESLLEKDPSIISINTIDEEECKEESTTKKQENPTNTNNMKFTRKELSYSFLATLYNYHLLMPNMTHITIIDLYQFNGLNNLLNETIATKQRRTLSGTIMKSTLFQNIISEYEQMGVIALYNNDNDCNLKPFLQLLSFIDSKCRTWLKLHTRINTINFQVIRQSFKEIIPNLDSKTIISLYKIVLNDLASSDRTIKKWYFELDQNTQDHKYALIHFIHDDST